MPDVQTRSRITPQSLRDSSPARAGFYWISRAPRARSDKTILFNYAAFFTFIPQLQRSRLDGRKPDIEETIAAFESVIVVRLRGKTNPGQAVDLDEMGIERQQVGPGLHVRCSST